MLSRSSTGNICWPEVVHVVVGQLLADEAGLPLFSCAAFGQVTPAGAVLGTGWTS